MNATNHFVDGDSDAILQYLWSTLSTESPKMYRQVHQHVQSCEYCSFFLDLLEQGRDWLEAGAPELSEKERKARYQRLHQFADSPERAFEIAWRFSELLTRYILEDPRYPTQ